MAEEKETTRGGATATRDEPRTYPRERILAAEAEGLLGVPTHVVVGALSMAKTGNKQNFTVDELKKAIKDFEEHEVEPPPGGRVPDAEEEES